MNAILLVIGMLVFMAGFIASAVYANPFLFPAPFLLSMILIGRSSWKMVNNDPRFRAGA
jgi:hypothetical protein